MKWQSILNDILTSILTTIVTYILSKILFVTPYKRHKDIKLKIRKLKTTFEDPNNYDRDDPINLQRIGEQLNDLKMILDLIDETLKENPIFAFLFNYKQLQIHIVLLFEYNRNPIMLPESKEFNVNYRMDLDAVFNKITYIMMIPKRLILFLVFLAIIISLILIIRF